MSEALSLLTGFFAGMLTMVVVGSLTHKPPAPTRVNRPEPADWWKHGKPEPQWDGDEDSE